MAGYIYRVGQRFKVLPENEDDADEAIGKVGMFNGAVSIEDGRVTHLWLCFPDSGTDTGYEIENLQPLRFDE
jgi:hypothetical protein